MKNIYTFLVCLYLVQPVYAESTTKTIEYDSIAIGYIPARSAAYKGEPYVLAEAKSLAHHKNKNIQGIYEALTKLASKGIKDNATQMHQPTRYIEAVFQGNRIRLFYSGKSGLDKYASYEKQWRAIHQDMYMRISRDISPDSASN